MTRQHLSDLIAEPSTRSQEFLHHVDRAQRQVPPQRRIAVLPPVAGKLTLRYNALDLPADPGQTMIAYTAEPGSPSHKALKLLVGWTPAPNQVTAARADDQG